jgi:hypothetical protein
MFYIKLSTTQVLRQCGWHILVTVVESLPVAAKRAQSEWQHRPLRARPQLNCELADGCCGPRVAELGREDPEHGVVGHAVLALDRGTGMRHY